MNRYTTSKLPGGRVDAKRLTSALARLEHHLTTQAPQIARGLRPPIEVETLPANDYRPELPLPEEVRIWFAWHDGMTDDPAFRLPSGYSPLPWKYAVKLTDMLTEPNRPDGLAQPGPSMLTLMNVATSYLMVDCNVSPGTVTPVRHWNTHEMATWPGVFAPSLTETVELWNRLLVRGAYRWDADGDDWAADVPVHLTTYGLTQI
ncbi:hypothetical protein Krad_2832 [Kineococcus radiotolerans SRS30216 = ATCC BAA-149]|uniref:Knr4/Smi1-like domain-containing protein n=1 Tax=Kineococcus radiotolerans (strain ATCC BAA-149 / DSM 14245 / SRS30216) TaxID=266940 RepID=A6WBW1_KINRD|nr:hypothetical protein Krad_2832 [Kineococcus radiotolerans SRS30216 = ATCC BAA-149]